MTLDLARLKELAQEAVSPFRTGDKLAIERAEFVALLARIETLESALREIESMTLATRSTVAELARAALGAQP